MIKERHEHWIRMLTGRSNDSDSKWFSENFIEDNRMRSFSRSICKCI